MLNPFKARKRIAELEAENKRLAAKLQEITPEDRKVLADKDLRKQAIEADKKRMRQVEETKRFEAKSQVSKEVIREMRAAIRSAILSIEDLANSKPNQVTAAHLHELANQAAGLKRFTDL